MCEYEIKQMNDYAVITWVNEMQIRFGAAVQYLRLRRVLQPVSLRCIAGFCIGR